MKLASSRLETPLPAESAPELIRFWEDIFAVSYEQFGTVLTGSEAGMNQNTLYLVRDGTRLVATTQLTQSCVTPQLGGLGEVATQPSHRRGGLAQQLCQQARDEFLTRGGEALFLGTHNPAAAQLYYRLGWRKLASSNVMCLVAGGRPPEEFLVEYFRGDAERVTVAAGDAGQRLSMIPLVVAPHDEQILDANLKLYSTRHAVQRCCLSLYPRYATLGEEGGAWFAATTSDGRLVGLASARCRASNEVQIDGFAHHNFRQVTRDLLANCLHWARQLGASRCLARVTRQQSGKQELFGSLGFSATSDEQTVSIDGTMVPTVMLVREAD